MAKTSAFDNNLNEYENWFIDNKFAYESEIEAIKQIAEIPENSVEIGIGSGLFAVPLGIKKGIDPSQTMINLGKKRGLNIIKGVAENLPWADNSIDYALMVTSICFVDDVKKSLSEAYRILKPNGNLIIAFVDKDSPIGKEYLANKDKSLFYKEATFFGTDELINLGKQIKFSITGIKQTVFGKIHEITHKQNVKDGYGGGSFVVLKLTRKIRDLKIE